MVQRDKKFLRTLAKASLGELRRRRLGSPFRTASKVSVETTMSDGWAATVGSFAGFQCAAQVWLDRFTGHAMRKVYYSAAAGKNVGLSRLVKNARREFGPHLSVHEKDLDREDEYTRLATRLPRTRFGRPVYEQYPGDREFYYGVYEFDRTGLQRNEFARLVERIVDFFQTIVESVQQETQQSDYDSYSTVENRRSVARHIQRERKSHAATLRKQRDNYICQTCRFDFSAAYGKLGNDFAEAHHIVPLGTSRALRSTTVDDLLTVCSNCHRMLHRMSGKSGDIAKLKQIVRKGSWPGVCHPKKKEARP